MHSHSVRLEKDKCIGCTDCIKRCPTEAIRVRGSKAKIIEERCIDCGNCIRICRNGAKKAVTDSLDMIKKYRYPIALPAPSFYAQFPKAERIEDILMAFYKMGFTDVLEVGAAGEVVAKKTYEYIRKNKHFPVISSSCPAIVRLIQIRFPSLIPHILPILSPMELAARSIKEQYAAKGISKAQVGVFFISPCPAKATEIHAPRGIETSYVDGVLSMQDLYKIIRPLIKEGGGTKIKRQSSYKGLMWARRVGGLEEDLLKSHIAVDGMENVIEILEKIEDGTLSNVEYVEALACTGGCLGGALTIENPFVSPYNLQKWIHQDKQENQVDNEFILKKLETTNAYYEQTIDPKFVFHLDTDRKIALQKMENIEKLYTTLPQIDCGSCGAPTCRCFAEDVITGHAHIEECIFMFRKRIKELSEMMHELTKLTIPTEVNQKKEEEQ